MIKILADSAIPWLDKLFAPHGEIACYSGREIDRSQLEGIDVLLARSTLKITKDLLKDTCVKFVGSATVGRDHVDVSGLNELGVKFAHAPGCNANAVSEYVVSAIAWHEKNGIVSFDAQLTAAVIGCGQIGGKVKEKLELLGFKVVVNDPPLEKKIKSSNRNLSVIPAQAGTQKNEIYGKFKFVTLDQALQADVICMHTPLTKTGDHPTFHLLDKPELEQINPNAVLINAGRGEVINNLSLLDALNKNSNLNVVLDVWENEPNINQELLHKVNLGTPHIAGHSWRGKVKGTEIIYQQTSNYFYWQPRAINEDDYKVPVTPSTLTSDPFLYDFVAQCYDIESDTNTLRKRMVGSSDDVSLHQFDRFRKNYYQRPEFSDLVIKTWAVIDAKTISKLGFNIQD